eukprot:CAMPEP_0204513400 /NCGR_PEP_ID=MMETSP0661-20131031/1485_1 /ASSEMBLY_ACC=CAM_ASM_000606 /TAXON_ID=109239 /ORGANISM="Alexandrium margalefi, Strain AMGDE01CS-322" /LENGTH=208 /DNA_ID=CAMNT_0051518573 /DNA_START=55 /DNA_END=681 /DNA_ORIENTATION=+
MGDLFAELAFGTEMAVIELPGHIIAESVKSTRDLEKPAPNFLHCDSGVTVDGSNNVTAIAGKPLEPQRKYRIATYQMLLTGLNIIEPLYSYVKANLEVPTEEQCLGAKDIVITVLMKDMWRQLLGCEKWGEDPGQDMPRARLSARVSAAFKEVDANGDGKVDEQELEALMTKSFGTRPGCELLKKMIGALDKDNDGLIDKNELWQLAW